jgi:hypothetical protein
MGIGRRRRRRRSKRRINFLALPRFTDLRILQQEKQF